MPKSLIQSSFQVSERGLRYLGIFVTPDLNNLFETNEEVVFFANLFSQGNQRYKNEYPSSTKLLFQNLSCYLTPAFFFVKSLNSCISQYIWNNKHQRVRLSKFTKPKELGGLSLPNLQLYYWSAQLKMMTNWFMNK